MSEEHDEIFLASFQSLANSAELKIKTFARPFELRVLSSTFIKDDEEMGNVLDLFSKIKPALFVNEDIRQAMQAQFHQIKRGSLFDSRSLRFIMRKDHNVEEIDGLDVLPLDNVVVKKSWIEMIQNARSRMDSLVWMKKFIEIVSRDPDSGGEEGENLPSVQVERIFSSLREFHENLSSNVFSTMLISNSSSRDLVSVEEVAQERIEFLQSLLEDREQTLGFKTHVGNLDLILGRLPQQEIIVVGARPGVGKTSVLLAIGKRAAQAAYSRYEKGKSENKEVPLDRVLFVSLEMSKEELVDRAIASVLKEDLGGGKRKDLSFSSLSFQEIKQGNLTSSHRAAIAYTLPIFGKMPLYFIDSVVGGNLDAISLAIRTFVFQSGSGRVMVMVDYLQLVAPSVYLAGQLNAILTQVLFRLKHLARELKICIIVASQLNRSSTYRNPPIPQMQDLRDSGSIEQVAHKILLLDRPAISRKDKETNRDDHVFGKSPSDEDTMKDYSESDLHIHVVKNRSGKTGVVETVFDYATLSFEDLSDREHSGFGYHDSPGPSSSFSHGRGKGRIGSTLPPQVPRGGGERV